MHVGQDFPVWRRRERRVQIILRQRVLVRLRRSVNGARVVVDEIDRGRAADPESVLREAEREMHFRRIAAIADVAIEATHLRPRIFAIAAVAGGLHREIAGEIALQDAILHRGLAAVAAAEAAVEIEALIGEAVLHIEHDGAAERVQSEQRIAGDDDAAVDGDGGDQVPVDRIPIGLVDAHAVLIDGESLGRSRNRRGDEPAKIDLWTEGIAQHVIG